MPIETHKIKSALEMKNGYKLPCKDEIIPARDDGFTHAGRSTYLRVDLDAIYHNIQVLMSRCADHTKVIAVIKASAYGHGSVRVAKFLNKRGIDHFAVATSLEGKELRENGVTGYIQVFGSCVEEEIETMLHHNLTPTATNPEFIEMWAAKVALHGMSSNKRTRIQKPSVVIKVDTGMSRNGCQCCELTSLMDACDKLKIPVHSIMTHFAQAWDDPEFTQKQLIKFLEITKVYRSKGIKVHAANTAAIIQGFAEDLDFVRPGIGIYGLPPDSSSEAAAVMKELGMKPALAWLAKPCLLKYLDAGRCVGYDQTYRLTERERIATFSFGYADGYNRMLSNKGVLMDENGKLYKVVGRVSMDAVTVHANDTVTKDTPFYVIKDDYDSPNSLSKIAELFGLIPYEIGTSLSSRLPRVYVSQEHSNF